MTKDSTRMPLVSVLIPLYNAEEYFYETMESLLIQTYLNIEIIIVDDGSTDNSLSIAQKYANKFSWIKIYSQENMGASAARNKAFTCSSGDYIQYLDADDILHPDKILFQINALAEYNYDPNIVATSKWARFHNSIKSAVFKSQITYKNYEDSLLFLKDAWDNFDYIVVPAWLVHRDFYEKIGKWNEKISVLDDGVFFANVAYNASKIIFIEESISYWRQDNPNSLSKNVTKEGMKSHLLALNHYVELIDKNLDYPGMKHALARQYSILIFRSFPLYVDIIREATLKINGFGFKRPVTLPGKKFQLLYNIIGFYPSTMIFRIRNKLVKIYRKRTL